ncbi:MAG: hypothetical protein NXI30_00755 [bacterium]|nr:hypothetical protein [bacterium]
MNGSLRLGPGLAALGLASLVLAPGAGAQMVIDEVIVTSGPCTLDGVHEGFFFDPVVFGSGIAGVALDTGSGATLPMTEVEDDEFVWDDPAGDFCRRFDSLAEIDALGALTFDFLGEFGELDTIVVPVADYENGAGQPGGPVMVAPAAGDTNLPPGNTFVWATAPAWTELISVDLVDAAIDDGIDEALFTNPAATSWTPNGIVPGNTYIHEVSFIDAYFLGDGRTSAMGRDYEFISGFQALERKYVPEPAVGGAICFGAVLLAVRARRLRRPG